MIKPAQQSPEQILHLRISLDDVKPKVCRVIAVQFGLWLDNLHLVFQAAMGWTNSYQYLIKAGGCAWGNPTAQDSEDEPMPANKASLADLVAEMVVSDPDAITDFVRAKAAGAVRVGLETGPTATWLWSELKQRGLPVICIDARHAKAALRMQINKSDRNDAFGIARIMQTGWYKQVHVETPGSHAIKALLVSRALLVKIKRDIENQIRGLLKNLGLVIGRAKMAVFCARTEELIQDRPEIATAVRPLLEARKTIEQQIAGLDRKVMKLARSDSQVRTFMTAPGIGPITALLFKATLDDPTRFARSRNVGAYLGLTPRRHASGEIDWTGRISKCGDALLRCYLFEAAGVLLTRVPKWSALKAWGMRLAKRNGLSKAKVAVARKLAVILHRMWIDGRSSNWQAKEVVA